MPGPEMKRELHPGVGHFWGKRTGRGITCLGPLMDVEDLDCGFCPLGDRLRLGDRDRDRDRDRVRRWDRDWDRLRRGDRDRLRRGDWDRDRLRRD